ncbi:MULTISPECIES: DUF3080 family protein [unclassified Halomonas]|uniref:DUF3080 family protein n=1 Tax=unclassified Halomonas TaxID=2609666 RepID=UPI001C9509DF|nr:MULTISPECIES: DUF3080 family protein [unclassified Halomonas]MBY5927081.1 DUF3080 domain-containing protein [Halomonas sp. DP4Y7-2]MBY6234123.1 DUF3080 domain-containing protein [Halomonas sp. DP4Y7-1]
MKACRLFALLAGLAVLLCGCGPSPLERELITYQHELADATGLSAPETSDVPNIGDFPERRSLTLEIPEVREGLLDVFALRGCHIANLVAQRNNQLGKTAAPSQHWLYELQLWRRLDHCMNTPAVDSLSTEDRERLARLTETKTRQLPLASYNALVASSEWAGSFSRASAVLDIDELTAVDAQLPALTYLTQAVDRQFDHQWQPDSAKLEQALKVLRDRPLSAELMRTLQLATLRLKEANGLLVSALGNTSLPPRASCPLAEKTPSADLLLRQMERLLRQSRRWFTAMDQLLDAHLEGAAELQRYRSQWLSPSGADTPLVRFREVLDHHRLLRQQWDQRCVGDRDLR